MFKLDTFKLDKIGFRFSSILVLAITGALFIGCGTSTEGYPPVTGQTEFTNDEPSGGQSYGGGADAGMAAADASSAPSPGDPAPGAPGGRQAEVEEAEIYRFHNDRLFYLNTYKGLVIYDLKDPKQPKRISRLPIYGYPIEMFFKGNTAYALVKDALYMAQVKGSYRFERHNVSQLITIDLSDIKKPRVIKRHDIIGQLREGVSRKVEDTIYVVSYQPSSYYRGWSYNRTGSQKDSAHVYSYNVADPTKIVEVNKLELFEAKSFSVQLPGGGNASKSFRDVGISATSNALMVAVNWNVNAYGGNWSCSSSRYYQEAQVSIIDISDPSGKIRVHTSFTKPGRITDQFKQTYLFDPKTQKGTYLGIFARNDWANCKRIVQNYIVSMDITDGKNPTELDALKFGKPNETVRGSVFDPKREVAFAITARAMDPLYAISFADLNNLKVLSEIDGLSGDISVFRFVAGNKFLMAVGRDNSGTCKGFGENAGWSSTKMAVSVIDVNDLSKIRLVQRDCVAVNSSRWQSSSISWNQDQAHKMLGMYSEPGLNLIAVPVSFYEEVNDSASPWHWNWYIRRSAIGMMSWDLNKYDPSKSHTEQGVLNNLGSLLHPNGEVERTIFFRHQGLKRRMVLTLSQTHMALTDIENLAAPKRLSEIELAPYYRGIYRVGAHLVEQVSPTNGSYYRPGPVEFRIKKAESTESVDDRPILAKFTVGELQSTVVHENSLLLFHRPRKTGSSTAQSTMSIYDLSDPKNPKPIGRLDLPFYSYNYYSYYCGMSSWYYHYAFQNGSRGWVGAKNGLLRLDTKWDYDYVNKKSTRTYVLRGVDLTDKRNPKYVEAKLKDGPSWEFFETVPGADRSIVYLSGRKHLGKKTVNGHTFDRFKYYAREYRFVGGKLIRGKDINLPGRLMKITRAKDGQALFVAYDHRFVRPEQLPSYFQPERPRYHYTAHTRMHLLRRVGGVAELLDSHELTDWEPKDLVLDGGRLYLNARRSWRYLQDRQAAQWDRNDTLNVFDLTQKKLKLSFSAALGAPYTNLMGAQNQRLFVKLSGDGVMVLDTTNPAKPVPLNFARTLGWVTHISFSNSTAYLAAGHYGIFEVNLDAPSIGQAR